ncbi:hypothetical protein BHE74_00048889 [Ensete ventricosum]|nr:hypothetical protein BHE74_00048889 [Ensete ventricosum]
MVHTEARDPDLDDGVASTKYTRGVLIPWLVANLYSSLSKVLIEWALNTMVLYGYHVALAWFRAQYPALEVEDPFKILPEDSNVPMEAEQPFDDSLPPLEE